MSDRTWHYLSKMDKNGKVERRKQQRRLHRSKIRQDILISEYVQYKYFDIYSEAADFYNALNNQYPTKYDLRKTDEYKNWKAGVTGELAREPKRLKPSHANIESSQFQTPIELHPQARITVTYEEQPQTPSDTGESQPASPNPSEHPQTPSDTGESRSASPNPSEHPQTPSDTGESRPASPNPSEHPQTPSDTGESSPVELQPRKHVYNDNLQLRIPLMQHKTPTKHPAVTTETLQVITEEILEEATLQPSLYEELSPELIEQIINEIRLEPDLQDILTAVEQQIEFEQLGMDIDIDIEDNALDIELDQW